MAFPGSAWKYVPSSGVPNPPRCVPPLSGGGFAPESASGAVCSHERAAALAEVGECGARSGCLRAVGGLPPETDDRGSRRRASGFLAATVAGGLGAPFALYGNACASHFQRRSFGPPKEHTLARVELSPSNGARLPAELKHITKRRKRNQQGCP